MAEARAGMAWKRIAESAYKAYAASTGGRNFLDRPMPPWDALPERIRTAWIAACKQVEFCASVPPDTAELHEERWAGWSPDVRVRNVGEEAD